MEFVKYKFFRWIFTPLVLLFFIMDKGYTEKVTAERFLSIPQRSDAVPNKQGTYALYSESQYSFKDHKKSYSIVVLDLESGENIYLLNSTTSVLEPVWLGEKTIGYLETDNEKKVSKLKLINDIKVDSINKINEISFNGSLSNLKVVEGDYENNSDDNNSKVFTFVASGWAEPNGELSEPGNKDSYDSGQVYESLFLRHWDYWVTSKRQQLFTWSVSIKKDSSEFKLLNPIKNLLSKSKLECPVPALGGSGDFDLSKNKVAFVSKSPNVSPAFNTIEYVYIVDLYNNVNSYYTFKLDNLGAASSPKFSPDGNMVAYLRQFENGYESDRNRIIIWDLEKNETRIISNDWEYSPNVLEWSSDGNSLFLLAEVHGRRRIFIIDDINDENSTPREITDSFSISSIYSINKNKVFASGSSFTEAKFYYVLDIKNNKKNDEKKIKIGKVYRFNDLDVSYEERIDDFWFMGTKGRKVHGWMIKPDGFDSTKKYPIAFLVHGGPQAAWLDEWSRRWNMLSWSDASNEGWIVVGINPTGSTGYGQDFTDSIKENWGSLPYVDLILGLKFLGKSSQFVDETRMIVAGGSYGGYMANWIQGNSFGRVFRAIVCHDGIFSTRNLFNQDELYFPIHDFGGTPWREISGAPKHDDDNNDNENNNKNEKEKKYKEQWAGAIRRSYELYDPSRLVMNWKTPQLTIHSRNDFRIPESEGILTFNALQAKEIPSKFLYFNDENHWVRKEENSLRWHKEIFSWINYWVSDNSIANLDEESKKYQRNNENTKFSDRKNLFEISDYPDGNNELIETFKQEYIQMNKLVVQDDRV